MTASMLPTPACSAVATGSCTGQRFSARASMATTSACIPGSIRPTRSATPSARAPSTVAQDSACLHVTVGVAAISPVIRRLLLVVDSPLVRECHPRRREKFSADGGFGVDAQRRRRSVPQERSGDRLAVAVPEFVLGCDGERHTRIDQQLEPVLGQSFAMHDVGGGPEEAGPADGVPRGGRLTTAMVHRRHDAALRGGAEVRHRNLRGRQLWTEDGHSHGHQRRAPR